MRVLTLFLFSPLDPVSPLNDWFADHDAKVPVKGWRDGNLVRREVIQPLVADLGEKKMP